MTDIAVVGSANIDRTVAVERFPVAGETLLGGPVAVRQGGKGANQAVAAARMGRSVTFVGRVGNDADGSSIRRDLRDEGVDVSFLSTSPGPSGNAFIYVDRSAENTIVVSPGSNRLVTPSDIRQASIAIANADVLIAQLEIPVDAVGAALEIASGIRILNPAPAQRLADLLDAVDVLVPNVGELATLTGRPMPSSPDEIVTLAASTGVDALVVTLGPRGALVIQGGKSTHVSPITVRAVDTTGAGDTFCGALADALARGLDLVEATQWAVVAAGLSVTAEGARTGMPTADQVTAAAQ